MKRHLWLILFAAAIPSLVHAVTKDTWSCRPPDVADAGVSVHGNENYRGHNLVISFNSFGGGTLVPVHELTYTAVKSPDTGKCKLTARGKQGNGKDGGIILEFTPRNKIEDMPATFYRKAPDGTTVSEKEICTFTPEFKEVAQKCMNPPSAIANTLLICKSDVFEKKTFRMYVRANDDTKEMGATLVAAMELASRERSERNLNITTTEEKNSCLVTFEQVDGPRTQKLKFTVNKTESDENGIANFELIEALTDGDTWAKPLTKYSCQTTRHFNSHFSDCKFNWLSGIMTPGPKDEEQDK